MLLMVSGQSLQSQKDTGNSSRIRIADLEKIHPGFQIQGVKKHRIPDPQHWGEPKQLG
jgi:hypothetical protein